MTSPGSEKHDLQIDSGGSKENSCDWRRSGLRAGLWKLRVHLRKEASGKRPQGIAGLGSVRRDPEEVVLNRKKRLKV